MSLRAPALLSAAVIALLAACSSPSTAPAGRAQPALGHGIAGPPAGPERSLAKGMTADSVRKIMGSPSEVKAMASPSGRAEVWLYYRTTPGGTRQVQVGSRTIPIQTTTDTNGLVRVVQSIEEPIFQQEYEYFDEDVRLLMFNDQFVEQARSFKRRLEYR